MRDTEHFKNHLFILTEIDGVQTDYQAIEDPFHTTRVIVGWNFWDWFKMLFKTKREVHIRVKIGSDGVSQGRWFQGADICERCKRTRIDGPGEHESKPGYEHGQERWCEKCYYQDGIPGIESKASNREVSFHYDEKGVSK